MSSQALPGRRYKKVPEEVKTLIIQNVIDQKRSLNEVSMIFNVPRSTIWNIVSSYRKSQRLEPIPRYGGRKRKFTTSDSSEIAQLATSNPADSLSSLKKEYETLHPDKHISISTIHTIIKHTNSSPGTPQNSQQQQQQQQQQQEQQQQQVQQVQQQEQFLNQQNLLSSTMAMPMSNDSYQIQRPMMTNDQYSSDSFCYQPQFFSNSHRSINIYQNSLNSLSDNPISYPSPTIPYENNTKQA